MIDPAILRPGRLDVKIKIERPDAEAAKDIFSKYVLKELPLHPDDVAEHGGSPQACVDAMIQRTVERMYTESEENRFLEVRSEETRLNSSHMSISYAVFCLKKKKQNSTKELHCLLQQ